MEEITVEQLRAVPSALADQRRIRELLSDGERRLRLLVDSIAERPIWQDIIAGVPDQAARTAQDKRERNFRWGRYGLYVLGDRSPGSWCPGVFVGVLQDSSDHGPPSVNDQQGPGPVACLIVDVDRRWHGQYKKSDAYSRLASALRRGWPSAATDDWHVQEHDRNLWHPLAIYKPLEVVFRSARTGDDQVDSFVDEVSSVASAVLGLDEFGQFQRSLV